MPNKLLVYCIDQDGNPLDATVTVDTGTTFAQEAAGRYAAGAVASGQRIIQADAPGCGSVLFQIEVPDHGQIEHRLVLPRFEIVVTPSTTVPLGSVLKVGTNPPLGEEVRVRVGRDRFQEGPAAAGRPHLQPDLPRVHHRSESASGRLRDSTADPGTATAGCTGPRSRSTSRSKPEKRRRRRRSSGSSTTARRTSR